MKNGDIIRILKNKLVKGTLYVALGFVLLTVSAYVVSKSFKIVLVGAVFTIAIPLLQKRTETSKWLPWAFAQSENAAQLNEQLVKAKIVSKRTSNKEFAKYIRGIARRHQSVKTTIKERSKENTKVDVPNKNDINTQRSGFSELGDVCLKKPTSKKYIQFIDELKDYTDHEHYMTTLNYVKEILHSTENNYIICVDWKQEISVLTSRVSNVLYHNFNLETELPKQNDYGERASVSFENVFKDFDKALNKINFQLSFIDTNSDEYVIVVHKIEDLTKVEIAIQKIGYPCLNASSYKISG